MTNWCRPHECRHRSAAHCRVIERIVEPETSARPAPGRDGEVRIRPERDAGTSSGRNRRRLRRPRVPPNRRHRRMTRTAISTSPAGSRRRDRRRRKRFPREIEEVLNRHPAPRNRALSGSWTTSAASRGLCRARSAVFDEKDPSALPRALAGYYPATCVCSRPCPETHWHGDAPRAEETAAEGG